MNSLRLRLSTTARPQVARMFSTSGMRAMGAHGHHHSPKLQESFLEAIQKRYPSADAKSLSSRFDQLKRNHMKILSLDINWNVLKPEEREENLRDIGDLVTAGYPSMNASQKKAVAMANVYTADFSDIVQWDQYLSKNDELQAGDWRNMSVEEKKAAHYIAWGPVPESDPAFKQGVAIRVAGMLVVAFGIWYSLKTYFRSKKDVPTLSPEWKAAQKDRMIHERMNPYTGVSAHLFTKDGIKEE